MKRSVGLLAIAFLLVPVLGAQESQKSEGEQEQKPTLGPAPAPTLHGHGPRTATVNDYRKLLRIRSIYIERMDNALSDKLVVSLGKLGRVKIASKPKEADAIMTGSCLESRRLKRLHSEVFIADRGGGSIWQDNIYRPYNPPSLEQAVDETAQLVAEHLGESFSEAGSM
jgi:hypothetical protein